ncbi:protein C2-DOMAIN ABA-RELATED 5-like [Panicum miliaceum]|uniref:Protein C2-DOMAIN ABA-RELATED 5-like n=1 Tax=Panicum miliaceum TaxID=4540 RepID=A0A3L6TD91_PANMI|nr:protein C2-DOMAIN ABA-RELATED 5-like [Panicum miliaceum]
MSTLPGFLSVKVLRGVNLVSRDANGSDPYVVLNLDGQKLKTGVMKKTVNPVWNEDLTLAVKNASTPIKLEVFDKDTFSKDDQMGDAEFDIEALMQIIQMDLEDIRSGTVVRTVRPGSHCCLADESHIIWENGQVVQDLLLKLRNVDTGVVHLQLRWVNVPGFIRLKSRRRSFHLRRSDAKIDRQLSGLKCRSNCLVLQRVATVSVSLCSCFQV